MDRQPKSYMAGGGELVLRAEKKTIPMFKISKAMSKEIPTSMLSLKPKTLTKMKWGSRVKVVTVPDNIITQITHKSAGPNLRT